MEALRKIQAKLNAPKGQRNNFGKYNYRSCEDILAAVKPLLVENEAQLIINDDIVLVGDRYYVKSTAVISASDVEVAVSAFARESLDKKGMDAAQITGAASSYARKYALNGLFAIDDTADADATNTGEERNTISELQVKKIKKLIADTDSALPKLLGFFEIKKIEEMTPSQLAKATSMLESKVAA